MILLIGTKNDSVTLDFSRYLENQDRDHFFLDQDLLGTEVHIDDEAILSKEKGKLYYSDFSGVLNRTAGVNPKSNKILDQQNYTNLLSAVLCNYNIKVANKPSVGSSNFSKPYQLSKFSVDHISIPDSTILANQSLTDFDHPVIYKSVSSWRSIVKKLDFNVMKNKEISCPTLFQSMLDGINIRVHVVNDKVFPIAVLSDTVDYRYSKNGTVYIEIDLPEKILLDCISLTKQADLILSGIDLIKVNENDFCFLEINTGPAFGCFESCTGTNHISQALMEFLSDE